MQPAKICFAVVLCILGAVAPGGAQAQSCGAPEQAFVQITLGRLDAGEITYDSFRVSQDGTLHRASWSDHNLLKGQSDPARLSQDSYRSIRDLVTRTDAQSSARPGRLGRRATIVDLVWYDAGRQAGYVSRDTLTENLGALIDSLRGVAPLRSPGGGLHLWVAPGDRNDEALDLVLDDATCGSGVPAALDRAMKTGRIVVDAPREAEAYTTGNNQYRSQFGAQGAGGYLRFGVLKTQ